MYAEPGVILDATFRLRDDRVAFAEAVGSAAPIVFVECLAPPDVVAERAQDRERDPARISEATVEIAEREGRRWEPLDEVAPGSRVAVRTDRELEHVIGDLIDGLGRRSAPT